jgi:hypothetical protein
MTVPASFMMKVVCVIILHQVRYMLHFCNDCVRTSPTISYVIGIISIASISLIFIISASLVIQALALQPPPSNPTHRPTHVNKREVAICNISQGIL